MNTLLCFDTDGVFIQDQIDSEYVSGPIDPKSIIPMLWDQIEVYVVSESPYFPKNVDGTPIFMIRNDKPSRYLNLQQCKAEYRIKYGKEPSLAIYVSDNGDKKEAEKAGFAYIHPEDFSLMFKKCLTVDRNCLS